MTKQSCMPPRPAIWERVLAIFTWLCTAITLLGLAIIIGLIEYFRFRNRRPFLAKHGLWAAILQGALIVFSFVIVGYTALKQISDFLHEVVLNVIPESILHPEKFQLYWITWSHSQQVTIVLVLVLIGLTVLTPLIGLLVALCSGWRTKAYPQQESDVNVATA